MTFRPYFSLIGDSLRAADYTVGNVDGPMGGKGKPRLRVYPQFNTPPHLLFALETCGTDMLTLANNHALDTYIDGLKRQLDVEKVGIDHVGAYRTQQSTTPPRWWRSAASGWDSPTTPSRPTTLTSGRQGRNAVRPAHHPQFQPHADIAALREAGAEVVVVYMHWGDEYVRELTASQKDLRPGSWSRQGADVIIGGHPHVVQPIHYVTAEGADGETRRALVVFSLSISYRISGLATATAASSLSLR